MDPGLSHVLVGLLFLGLGYLMGTVRRLSEVRRLYKEAIAAEKYAKRQLAEAIEAEKRASRLYQMFLDELEKEE